MTKKLTVHDLTREQCNELYEGVLKDRDYKTMRWLCLNDLFFLLTVACRRQDMNKDWIYDRVREFEADSDGFVDLWFRAGYKSSIITFGGTIQEILNDPETTAVIFSHTRPIAKAFGTQIKRELEGNEFLKGLFPDILYKHPHKESPKWSIDDGFIVKRKSNPKEATLECWGLVDGQPTSKHYRLMIYDDIVTRESVNTPEMISKTTDAFALSFNLASETFKRRIIGTRYHQNDTYSTIIERNTARPRIYPATEDGTMKGKSVFLSQEELDEKLRDMGSYVFACQMLQNPLEDSALGFHIDWMEYYDVLRPSKKRWNYYLMVDPASEKKKDNDFTSMWVVGLAPDGNYYIVDGVRDRINLTERTAAVMRLHRLWKPVRTGYEKYGMQSDIEHIKYVQQHEGYRFRITELKGSMPKNDRIRRLVPVFEQGRLYFPTRLHYVTIEGKAVDLVEEFKRDEYMTFPVGKHDDMLDCLSRIMDDDLNAVFPTEGESIPLGIPVWEGSQEKYDPLKIGKPQKRVMKAVNRPTMSWREVMTNSN